MVFHWSLRDSKSSQVSWTRLRILAVFNNAVVWMVSTRPPTFKSSRPFNNSLVTVPKAPILIGTIVTFMFHNFFNSLARSRYLSFFSHSFSFILWSAGTAKSTILQILFSFCLLLLLLLLSLSLRVFHTCVFHWYPRDRKSVCLFWFLLTTQANFHSAVIKTDSIFLQISNSSIHFDPSLKRPACLATL